MRKRKRLSFHDFNDLESNQESIINLVEQTVKKVKQKKEKITSENKFSEAVSTIISSVSEPVKLWVFQLSWDIYRRDQLDTEEVVNFQNLDFNSRKYEIALLEIRLGIIRKLYPMDDFNQQVSSLLEKKYDLEACTFSRDVDLASVLLEFAKPIFETSKGKERGLAFSPLQKLQIPLLWSGYDSCLFTFDYFTLDFVIRGAITMEGLQQLHAIKPHYFRKKSLYGFSLIDQILIKTEFTQANIKQLEPLLIKLLSLGSPVIKTFENINQIIKNELKLKFLNQYFHFLLLGYTEPELSSEISKEIKELMTLSQKINQNIIDYQLKVINKKDTVQSLQELLITVFQSTISPTFWKTDEGQFLSSVKGKKSWEEIILILQTKKQQCESKDFRDQFALKIRLCSDILSIPYKKQIGLMTMLKEDCHFPLPISRLTLAYFCEEQEFDLAENVTVSCSR